MLKFKNKSKLTKKIRVALHHSAVSRSKDNLQAPNIRSWHKQQWNMPSELNGSTAGYNFICEPTGFRTQERFIGEETIAQVGHNCDVLSRCDVVSYCMAGDFRVEKPTQMQVDDFTRFIDELESAGFEVELTRHADVQPNRTCPILTIDEIQSWFSEPDGNGMAARIEYLEGQLLKRDKMIEQLTGMVTLLISILKKR